MRVRLICYYDGHEIAFLQFGEQNNSRKDFLHFAKRFCAKCALSAFHENWEIWYSISFHKLVIIPLILY